MNKTMPTENNKNNEISDCECQPKCSCRSTPEGRRIAAWLILVIVVTWIMGAVIAKGFWLKLAAYIFPPYAWYLLTEKAMLILLGAEWLQ